MTEVIHPGQQEVARPGHRFFLLFLFLLATLLLYPFAENNLFAYYAFRIIGSAAILISVYAAKVRHGLLIIAMALAVPALIHRILLREATPTSFSVVNMVLSFVFDAIIVIVIFRRVFARDEPNSETIFGALCVYLLVGFSFASVYGMLGLSHANAFYLDPRTNVHTTPDRFDFIYYSFSTMTSLGAAGIIPVSPQARAVTVVEAIFGVLYLAVLVARLIGTYRDHA
jgi:uncharacterized membrane protein